jgi:hypothetical protein
MINDRTPLIFSLGDVVQWRPTKKGHSLAGTYLGKVLVRTGDHLEPMFAVRRPDGQVVVFGPDPASDPLV